MTTPPSGPPINPFPQNPPTNAEKPARPKDPDSEEQ